MDTKALLHRQAVEELFDDYAETFEEHLVGTLDYRGPEVVARLFKQFAVDLVPTGAGVVVDLGCGTGLCGVVVRPHVDRLIGIDISAGMCDMARSKGADGSAGGVGQLFDELVVADAAVGLSRQTPGSVDHIVAGDMFIYVWSMDVVLRACCAALRPGGTLIFTTESMEEREGDEGWIERESERFAHKRSFVVAACEAQGFEVEHCEQIELRREPGRKAPEASVAVAPPVEAAGTAGKTLAEPRGKAPDRSNSPAYFGTSPQQL